MMRLLQFFKTKTKPILLARWKLKYDEKMINDCVFWANVDHCGCCTIQKNDNDEYYFPFLL